MCQLAGVLEIVKEYYVKGIGLYMRTNLADWLVSCLVVY